MASAADRGPLPAALDLGLPTSVPAGPCDLIAATARGLDNDWRECYLFVRNQIRFTPCKGFMRGPDRTLLDREGSAGDQAFLLLALLRMSGYTATVRYIAPPDIDGNGGFRVPLGGTDSGYDAACWVGVPTSGSATDVANAVWSAMGSGGQGMFFWINDTPQTSVLATEHFYVRLTLAGGAVDLDPSFKPRAICKPSASLLADMGYGRTNLLAAAGGTVTNDWFVRGLSVSNLNAELRRLSANLAARWLSAGTNHAISSFIGGDSVVPQNNAADGSYFHGTPAGTPVDFLSQTDAYKNAFRAYLAVAHSGFTTNLWLDEIAARHLWLAYTNASGYTYPKAALRLDDAVIVASETNGSNSSASDPTYITTYHPAAGSMTPLYNLNRALTNVYAIPVGFGGDHAGGMRARAVDSLGRLRAAGLAETNVLLRSRVLQVIGQQWLSQTALFNALDSRFKGVPRHYFYCAGVAGQERSPFVDLKNSSTYSSGAATNFNSLMLFASALEHGVLDQVNGTGHPAVSTIRLIDLANSTNQPICLAISSNWQVVKASLTNYGTAVLGVLHTNVYMKGHWALLPQNGKVNLNRWSGYGYIDFGPSGMSSYSTVMAIGGGLNGGFTGDPYRTLSADSYFDYERFLLGDYGIFTPESADPVDMRSGASLATRTDLAMAAPAPLVWARRYDSRSRWADGPLGRGWAGSFDSRLRVTADPDAFLGRAAPAACVPSAVAAAVAADLLAAGMTAKNLSVASLVAKWWADQLVDGSATVKTDNEALSYTRSPDGSYVPPPGVTAALTRNANGFFALQERLGKAWLFATNGVLSGVTDPSGNSTTLAYTNADRLVSVSNSFGRSLAVAWSGGRIVSVTDSANRGVSYLYSAAGCLTGVTDAAGCRWAMAYDADGQFISETDPSGVRTVLNAYNGLGQVTNQIAASGRSWPFGFAAGVSAWECDPFSNRIAYAYGDEGRLVRRVNRDGGAELFFYDGQGQTVSNLDASCCMTVWQYDASNRLVRVTEAAGTPDARNTAFTYDGQHRLVAVSNALGRVTRFGYDACHRLTLTCLPDGSAVTNVYDVRGLPVWTAALDASGRPLTATAFTYDARGYVTSVSPADGGTLWLGCDNAGNVTNVTDAMGHPTRLAYDSRGMVSNVVDALGGRTVRRYTSAGRLSIAVDPLGRTNSFLWTPGGKPAALVSADGGVSTNEFDAADRLVAFRDVRGNRVAFGLDPAGRVTNRTASAWSDYAWFDAAGRVIARVDAATGRTDIGYDSLGRAVAVTDPMRRGWTNFIDALGSLTASADPRGRVTVYGLDALGRRNRTAYPSGRTECLGLDALGRLTSFTNSEGRVFRLAYDGQGRILAATNGAGERVFRNLFDVAGNLTNRTDGAGRVTRYRYDALNRRVETLYADGSREGFAYDAAGNVTAASNAASRLSFASGATDRLTSSVTRVSGQTFAVRYAYDLGGLATNVTYPDGKAVRYAYDSDGRLSGVDDWAGRSWTFTRDAAGRLTALSYPNGVSGSWTHDANHNVSGWSYSKGSALAGRTITRDAAGVKIQEQATSGLFPNPQSPRRAANTFDAADRLVSSTVAVGTNMIEESYFYDGTGALTNVTRGAETQDYEYDFAARLTFASSTGVSLAVTYDALGNRLTTYSGNATRIWITDHADPRKRPLMEADANGAPMRYYVWGGGFLLAVVEADGVVRYVHSDEQGSVIALTDSTGAVTDQYCYGPYGTDWGHTGTNSIPFRWLGSHGVFNVGSSSLHLTRYRAYDAYMGRFLAQDPLALGGGPNLYAYCMGSPLAYIDPLGLGAEATGDWVIGPADNPWLVFDRDIGNDLADGLFAGLDGLVPFADPFENRYDPFDNNLIVSRFLGSVSQVALTQAAGLGAVRAINSSLMPSTLYHFTSVEGAAGIRAVSGISAGSGVYGPGVYLTAFNNATMAGIQGAVHTEVAIPVAVEGLTVSATYFPGTYVVRGVSILLP